MRECGAEGCTEGAPGYNEFCDQHSPPNWRCECGDLNRWHEAFCYRCGAGPHESVDALDSPKGER